MFYFLIILFGAAFGSFFNVCIYRIPRKESIIAPGSRCPQCGEKIKSVYNIPILSYLLLKGKCNKCNSTIPMHYFLVEILTPVLFILLFISLGSLFSFVFLKYLVFISFGLIILFIDFFHYIIPDKLSLPLIALGIFFSFTPVSDISWKSSIAGALFCFVVFFVTAYMFKFITKKDYLGGGDIKLMTAIGSFLGILGSIFTIFFSSAIAFIMLLIIKHDKRKEFPFGPFLIFGAFIYILIGRVLTSLYLDLFRFIR
ncbi:MAG: prepilin peptidase [Candidatus Cloacimonetes bacterium]|nr:prepilin peptidase [Candidatus Cloacimonadota bacterium]